MLNVDQLAINYQETFTCLEEGEVFVKVDLTGDNWLSFRSSHTSQPHLIVEVVHHSVLTARHMSSAAATQGKSSSKVFAINDNIYYMSTVTTDRQ